MKTDLFPACGKPQAGLKIIVDGSCELQNWKTEFELQMIV